MPYWIKPERDGINYPLVTVVADSIYDGSLSAGTVLIDIVDDPLGEFQVGESIVVPESSLSA